MLYQWLEIRPTHPPRIFIIGNIGEFYLTVQFPTKYAELHKIGDRYELTKSDDENTDLVGRLLENVLNNVKFLEEYKTQPLSDKWNVSNLAIEGVIDHFCIRSKNFYIQINRDEFIDLIGTWQKLVEQGPEKIYLVLEDGDFRITDYAR